MYICLSASRYQLDTRHRICESTTTEVVTICVMNFSKMNILTNNSIIFVLLVESCYRSLSVFLHVVVHVCSIFLRGEAMVPDLLQVHSCR